MSKYGINDKNIEILNAFFKQYDKIEEVMIFGSRATNLYTEYSDIDFAIKGRDIDFKFIQHLSSELDELPMPYTFDVIDYNSIDNEKLLYNIDKFGKIFYKKEL